MKKVTDTPVKAASKTTPSTATAANPFLETSWQPRYDAMTPAACEAALETLLPLAHAHFANVEKQLEISWKGIQLAPMLAVREVMEVWGMLSHLTSVVNTPEWRAVEEKYLPQMIALGQEMSQSKALYEGSLALQAQGGLEPWQAHILESSIRAMKTSGVGLVGPKKRRFNRLQMDLSKLSMQFSNHVLDAEKAIKIEIATDEAAGIPKDLLVGPGPWSLGIDFATYDAVMRYAESSDVRRRFMMARITRASAGELDNAPLIEKILKLRQELAELLGFKDYAHLSTSSKMAGTPENVMALLLPMLTVGKPAAKQDEADLKAFAKAQGYRGKLQAWDKAYWIEKDSQQRFGFDEEALRVYFPMERVLEGLFDLVKDLFGVSFIRQKGNIHAWHKDVRFYQVQNDKGELVAGFYFDPYARPGTKHGGAWMNEIRVRDFEVRQQLPIAVVCCNQKPPVGKAPATMSIYEISTLFHEVGHALQEMLTQMDSSTCSGINNVEWDAVEIASQFLEQFPNEVKMMRALSKHIKTGEQLPLETAKAIVAKRTYRAGSALVRQLHLALTDLALHAKNYSTKYKTANACKEAIGRKCLVTKMIEEDRFLNAFTHIFAGGYSAGYYSYKWSETLSADIYSAFLGKTAAQRRSLGKRYLKTFLALGGSMPAAEVFKQLMGREPDVKAILRLEGLITD